MKTMSNEIHVQGSYYDIHDNQSFHMTVYGDKANVHEVKVSEPKVLDEAAVHEYAMRLYPECVRPEWRERFPELWKQVIHLPTVEGLLCEIGKQQGTSFNRNLVANLLHLLSEMGVLQGSNTLMAELLEGDKNASVRARLGEMPPDKALIHDVKALLA